MSSNMSIMQKYQEITIIPHSEIDQQFIYKKLYRQLHLAFATIQNSDAIVPVGVSFPEYQEEIVTEEDKKQKREIGSKLRLFAQEENILNNLNIAKYLARLKDYIHFTLIREVPSKVESYEIYSRRQSQKNIYALARRKVNRPENREKKLTYEEALQGLNKDKPYQQEIYNLPFIIINSSSSNQHFPIFIERQIVTKENYAGFNSYGLSKVSTVPKF